MTVTEQDKIFMQQALDLALKGRYSTKPNPAVGCVLVRDHVVLAEGWHQKAGQPHAERVALANAAAQGVDVKGATAYVTLEPCSHHGRTPPCADGLIEAKVSRVVIGMLDPNPLVAGQGVQRLEAAGIEVLVGVLAEQAEALNCGFLQRMRDGLPYVRVKIAASLDGRTAMADGTSQWITGAQARLEVHKMRAQAGAVIIGIGTVLMDDPSMTVRLTTQQLNELGLSSEGVHPLRVVLDPHLSMPLQAKMLQLPGRTILMTSKESVESNPAMVEQLLAQRAEIVAVAAQDDRLDIESILHYLADEEQINDVMVETGAVAAGAFVESGYVNEIHAFIAPLLMGHQARPMFELPSVQQMADKLSFTIQQMDKLGDDIRLILTAKKTIRSDNHLPSD
ncbi:riboflavin biosynthesis protein RibD [Thiosulfatimonas sediminis]|uniref:Riboflavin biosynthesis protein RibD n=1 Tax=Thiosulfatimonas sediminis TaxID=2675054 RepID=A0A6F8PUP7_9GAMM|nr:bifunctional diaminohydroxyphosphoribosylaminopyrimidine deaminase/5-amino-6-(5-phosphoribosylamino)uracil reductase RibD [Thiosulfatimonas sediminis]BBP45700.1 riboflavin biosynthesis protein RibD [Thiosulfatimonas sediminis]